MQDRVAIQVNEIGYLEVDQSVFLIVHFKVKSREVHVDIRGLYMVLAKHLLTAYETGPVE